LRLKDLLEPVTRVKKKKKRVLEPAHRQQRRRCRLVCKVTPVILHGVVSPEFFGIRLGEYRVEGSRGRTPPAARPLPPVVFRVCGLLPGFGYPVSGSSIRVSSFGFRV